MPSISEIVGERIRFYRTKQNLSQEALAFQADINITFLGQVERGVKKPTIETLDKILTALGVSYEEFFSANIDSVPRTLPIPLVGADTIPLAGFSSNIVNTVKTNLKPDKEKNSYIEKINTYLAKASENELRLIYGIVKQILNYARTTKK